MSDPLAEAIIELRALAELARSMEYVRLPIDLGMIRVELARIIAHEDVDLAQDVTVSVPHNCIVSRHFRLDIEVDGGARFVVCQTLVQKHGCDLSELMESM